MIILITYCLTDFIIFSAQQIPFQRASCCVEASSQQTLCPTGVPLWPWLTPCRTTSPRRSSC